MDALSVIITRYHPDDVATSEDGIDLLPYECMNTCTYAKKNATDIELRADHMQVFPHSRQVRVVYIAPVKVYDAR